MRSNSNGCLATSGENAEVQRGLHKLTENPLSKGGVRFSAVLGHCFVLFFNAYRGLMNTKIGTEHKRFTRTMAAAAVY